MPFKLCNTNACQGKIKPEDSLNTMYQKPITKVILLFCLLTPVSAQATTILQIPFAQVVTASTIIFEGQVIAKEVRTLSNGQPMTFFTFRIDELLKGDYKGTTIELGFLGGEDGDQNMQIQGLQMPKVSERGIYFTEDPDKLFVNPLYGWHQGHYTIRKGVSGKAEVKRTSSDVNEYQTQKQQAPSQSTGQGTTNSYSPTAQTSQDLSTFKQKVRSILEDPDD